MRIFAGTFKNSGFKGNKHHLYGVIYVYMYVFMYNYIFLFLCMFAYFNFCMYVCCLLIYVCMYVIYVIRHHINVK